LTQTLQKPYKSYSAFCYFDKTIGNIMTAFSSNTDRFIKQRMMVYLREQGFNFYQSAILLKLTQQERDILSRDWTE
tara:strand:+ start:477 stop:704 length:228 start_codon:yes stop_codon:yes gene_type:complete